MQVLLAILLLSLINLMGCTEAPHGSLDTRSLAWELGSLARWAEVIVTEDGVVPSKSEIPRHLKVFESSKATCAELDICGRYGLWVHVRAANYAGVSEFVKLRWE